MASRRLLLLFVLAPLMIVTACYARKRPCYTPEEAARHADKDICLNAHIYDVVDAPDGTRYMTVCRPGAPDADCRLTIVSLAADRKTVGSLEGFNDKDVHVRGVVHMLNGQAILLLSSARQFHDGPERFRPNPALAGGFSAESGKTAFHDPALSSHRHRGASAFAGNSKSQ